jgi:hypothetical protein
LPDDRYCCGCSEHADAWNLRDASACLVVAAPIENALLDPEDLFIERAKARELILQAVYEHGGQLLGQRRQRDFSGLDRRPTALQ